MNEPVVAKTHNETPSTRARDPRAGWEGLRILLFVLILMSALGVWFLATDVPRCTPPMRAVFAVAVLFHLILAAGIFRRAPFAWRTAFVLPVLWPFVFILQMVHPSAGWMGIIAVIPMVGISIWNTIIWRRWWMGCRDLFH
jgi:hypothetical protein